MNSQSLIYVDRISFATAIASALCDVATAGTRVHSPNAILEFAISIFPFIGRFSIVKDGGGGLRWMCLDAANEFESIVFTRPILAQQQVRDWILTQLQTIEQAIFASAIKAEAAEIVEREVKTHALDQEKMAPGVLVNTTATFRSRAV